MKSGPISAVEALRRRALELTDGDRVEAASLLTATLAIMSLQAEVNPQTVVLQLLRSWDVAMDRDIGPPQ